MRLLSSGNRRRSGDRVSRGWGPGDEVERWQGPARRWVYAQGPGGPVLVLPTRPPSGLSPLGLQAHSTALHWEGSL